MEIPAAPAAELAATAAMHARVVIDRFAVRANIVLLPIRNSDVAAGLVTIRLGVRRADFLPGGRTSVGSPRGANMQGSSDFKVTSGLLAVALTVGGAGLSFPLLQMLLGICALVAAGYFVWTPQARLSPYARVALALAASILAL